MKFFFSLNTLAHAAEVPLKIAMSDVGPFSYSVDGKLHGLNYDILKDISKHSGIKFSFHLYPHIRLVNSLSNIKPDLAIVFEDSCLKYKSEYEVQTKLYTSKPTLFLTKSANTDLSKLRIGLIRGTCVDLSTKYLKHELVMDIADMGQAMEMLKGGRIDGVCGLPLVVKFNLEKVNYPSTLLKSHTDSKILQAVLCRKRELPENTKRKLELAVKEIKIPKID
ncbi:substrate-binding periplasmic protein [Bdellovibrio svalbardensis]|uniref:Transporter substrate-binding domain-containing protein n=1 Tax=Bdellovibrio svalbardensis TaxID=2972972 RepID=A0ABT6DL99_9BACT|nr:transporter substrate-binding domain-containing protein [Bdellovibrio svalbardensis]MDG0817660.1 transporter substrate-binding domain-containing protein [Bdellovibrio svalbardensis]